MRAWLASLALLAAGACAPASKPAVVFRVVEAKGATPTAEQPARVVFEGYESPVFVIDGAGIVGKELFVEVRVKDGKTIHLSPVKMGSDRGNWFSMGRLKPGAYQAVLHLDGEPAADAEFSVLP